MVGGAVQAVADVVEPLQVDDALADGQQVIAAHRLAPQGGHTGSQVVGQEAVLLDGAEFADAQGVGQGAEMLAIDDHIGFVLFVRRVHQFGQDVGGEEALGDIPRPAQVQGGQGVEVVGPPVAGGVPQAKAFGEARLLTRQFQPLDVHGVAFRLAAEGLRGAAHPLGQQVAQAPPMGDALDQAQDGRGVAPFQRKGLIAGQQAPLVQLQGKGDGHAGRDGIQAVAVAQSVGVENDLRIVDPAQGTKSVGRLVLRPADLDGVGAGRHPRQPPAPDGAGIAALHLEPVAVKGVGVDLLDKGDLGQLVVAGRLVAADILGVHEKEGPLAAQPLQARVGGQFADGNAGGFAQGRWNRRPPSGADVDGLEVLAAHDRPRPAPGRRPVVIVDDGRQAHAVLPRRADAGQSPGAGLGSRPQDRFVDGIGGQAPQVGGRFDGDGLILDAQQDGLRGAPGDEDGIVPGVAHFGGEKTAAVGIAVHAGQRRFEGDVQPGRGGPGRAGQQAGGQDEVIFRGEGIGLGRDPVEQEAGPQAAPAQEAAEQRVRGLGDLDAGRG